MPNWHCKSDIFYSWVALLDTRQPLFLEFCPAYDDSCNLHNLAIDCVNSVTAKTFLFNLQIGGE